MTDMDRNGEMIALAREHRLHHDRLEDGEVVIPSRRGDRGFVYFVEPGRLGWCHIDEAPFRVKSAHLLGKAKAEPMFTIGIEGDVEFTAEFDVSDLGDVATRWVQARKMRPAGTADHLRKHHFPRHGGNETDAEARQAPDATETTGPGLPGENNAENGPGRKAG